MQLTFEKHLLVFCIWYQRGQVVWNGCKYHALFERGICGRPDFLHVLEPKQHMQQTERGSSRDDPLSSIKPDIRGLLKYVSAPFHTKLSLFWKREVFKK